MPEGKFTFTGEIKMKKTVSILLTAIMTVTAMSVLMTGCGEKGKIGNGDNGTITDNAENATNTATELITENMTATEIMTAESLTDTATEATEELTAAEQVSEADTQGVMGEIGDAIDDGVSDIAEGIFGTERPTNG